MRQEMIIFSGKIEEGQTQKYDLSTAKVVNLIYRKFTESFEFK